MSSADQRQIQSGCGQANLAYRAIAETGSLMNLGGRLTAFVFDTTTLSRQALRDAVARASSILELLPRDQAVAVVTTGVAPRMLQDFTRLRPRVRVALEKVERPETPPDALTAVTSVRSLCGTMARAATATQQFYLERGVLILPSATTVLPSGRFAAILVNAPMLHYFTTGVEQKLVAPRELFDVAATCANANVSFFILDSPWISPVYSPPASGAPPGMRQIGYDVGIGLSLAARRPDCPVALTMKRSELDNGYLAVSLRNESAKLIERITLGAVVTPNDDTLNVPRILMLPGPSTSLLPGHSLDTATLFADYDVLAQLSRQGARADIGVVEVQFGDGTKWVYDLKGKGRFER